jgi:hypothetical protein
MRIRIRIRIRIRNPALQTLIISVSNFTRRHRQKTRFHLFYQVVSALPLYYVLAIFTNVYFIFRYVLRSALLFPPHPSLDVNQRLRPSVFAFFSRLFPLAIYSAGVLSIMWLLRTRTCGQFLQSQC